jgi:hypothetical protein
MNIYDHSLLSSHRFGGEPKDYLAIHEFMDSSKKMCDHFKHRIALHHNLGIHLAERIMGLTVGMVPVRDILRSHIIEDCGRYMTINEWLDCLNIPEPINMPYPRNEFESEVYAFCNGDKRILHLLRTDFFTYISYRWDKSQPILNKGITRLSKIDFNHDKFMTYPTSLSDRQLLATLKSNYNERINQD